MAKLIRGINDLQTRSPELAADWHPSKNGELMPYMVACSSDKTVWWRCENGHEWKAIVGNRFRLHSGCPYCAGQRAIKGVNDLATINPELLLEWNYEKNGALNPEDVAKSSGRKIWWKCKKGHEWQASVSHRSAGQGCPYCSGHRVLKGFNDLATVNSELASEWHPIKNDSLKPEDVTQNSNRKVWWLGKCGHEWQAIINNRSKGRGCPYCSGNMVLKGFNDISTVNPELAQEWHPTKNKNLTPDMFTKSSGKIVWWMCKEGHEWQTSIANRNSNSHNCPYCAGQRVIKGENDLFTMNPDLASEWHPIKNGSLKPEDVVKSSGKKVWWKCKIGHEWKATIASRYRGRNCPICQKESQTSFAEQAIYYYLYKQFPDAVNRDTFFGKELDIYVPSIRTAIEYDGGYYHKDIQKDRLKNKWCLKNNVRLIRIREKMCPSLEDERDIILRNDKSDESLNKALCELLQLLEINYNSVDVNRDRISILNSYVVGQKQNSFAKQFPVLAKEWHPTKNGHLKPDMVNKSSSKRVWWQCEKGHEWQSTINNRSKGFGCPYCTNRKVLKGFNDLAFINPELASEWHPIKNNELKPDMVTSGSKKKVWWQCKDGHEWQAAIYSRNIGCGCPYCSGRYAIKGKTDLSTVNPELALEWHPIKNKDLTPNMVKSNSSKKVWWQCEKGHEWQERIIDRKKGRGCPYCQKR